MSGAALLPVSQRIAGRYVIEAVLGRGHSATVYRARDETTGTFVALKVLALHLAVEAVSLERFRREAQILQQLDHPNVVKVYGLEQDLGTFIIVMEYFEALDCKRILERDGHMSVTEVVALAKTVAAVLDACHRRQIIHRDLKPQNILRNQRGDLKLVDFGVARIQTQTDLTRTGTVFGTPQYLAPELFRTTRADPRSDIYALGVSLYECLTGRPPFPATTLGAVLAQQMRNAIEPLSSLRSDVPAWLAAVIHKCLRLDPGRRYQSAHEFLRDVEKNEQAAALREERLPEEPCNACQAPLIFGMPFCPACSAMIELILERGPATLILDRCEATRPLAAFLTQQFAVKPQRIETALRKLPVVLCRGLSQRTARSLMRRLALFGCEAQVVERQLGALQVPLMYAAVGIASVLPLFWIADHISALERCAIIVAAEAIVLGLYWWRSRPILSGLGRRQRAASAVDLSLVEPLARALPGIKDVNLRMILAHIVHAYLNVHEQLRRSTTPIRSELILPAVQAAFAAASVLERQQLYLSGTSAAEVHGREQTAAAALAKTTAIADATLVIGVRTAAARAANDFESLDAAHSDLYLALFNLQVILQRLDEALRSGNGAADVLSELRSLAGELHAAGGEGD
ncbi:MAG TPA: serine/threonine-protein kinase [Candidatus Acidoferrales bacterium]|nr:serine/threonine-protein kinase [Candidatus Acidoferrales bacterium]